MKTCLNRFLVITAALGLLATPAFAVESQFIENMPEMAPDGDRSGAMIWVKPGVDRAVYKMVMIEPMTIFISPDSKYQGLSVDDLHVLSQHFAETITKTLEPEVPIVSQAGQGVLYLRTALTNVEVKKKKRRLLGYTPIGLVAGAVKTLAVGPSLSLKNAVLEVEMLDSQTGERVGVLIDNAPKTAESKELSWDAISDTFAFYAERFKARMLAAQQK